MKRALIYPLVMSFVLPAGPLLAADPAAAAADYHAWASTPPMGWNSWDCFGTTVTEQQTKQQTDFMAEKLKSHGWRYIVVDIQWYQPTATGHDYKPGAKLAMDEFSRLVPAPEKFPSAANGQGFKPLADYVHSKGLKFGIHMMRGISRQAVQQNTPIKDTTYHAADIANTKSACPWNPDMYGVDMSKPGAQTYYDSLLALVAGWGVDFIKADDMSYLASYQRAVPDSAEYAAGEIAALHKAIRSSGRSIVRASSSRFGFTTSGLRSKTPNRPAPRKSSTIGQGVRSTRFR